MPVPGVAIGSPSDTRFFPDVAEGDPHDLRTGCSRRIDREITSNEHLRSLIGQLGDRLEANGRARDEVDISAMSVGSFVSAADSMERHLDVIGELADIGVNWTMFPYPRDDFDAALDYLRAFGEEVAAVVR